MGPAYMFSRGVETLRVDGYLALVLLTHGELVEYPPLVKQIWEFLEEQLEVAESREMTVGRFVTAANEVTIGGFWREHAKGELRTSKDHEILKF